jgi:NIMA (never in mitosis gene a)-related kinase
VHRDIKPANFFLSRGGSSSSSRIVKLGDFGVSRREQDPSPSPLQGTPFYLSPELCEGRAGSKKSDIWSLGATLYELLTLQRPFDGGNVNSLVMKIIRARPNPLPDLVSDDVRALVKWMLQKNPADRPRVEVKLKNINIINFFFFFFNIN